MGSSGCEHSATSRWGIWNATGGCCLLCACWRPVLLVRTCRDSSQCNQLRCLSLRRPVSVFRPSRDGGLSHPHQLWSVAGGHFDGRVTIWAAGVRTASLRPAGLWTTVLRTAGAYGQQAALAPAQSMAAVSPYGQQAMMVPATSMAVSPYGQQVPAGYGTTPGYGFEQQVAAPGYGQEVGYATQYGDAPVYYTDATPTKKKKKGGVCC